LFVGEKSKHENRVSLLDTLFGGHRENDAPDLMGAIDWAVDRVDPLLKQMGGYPDRYRKPVAHALEYAHDLAARIPGPVAITPESYVADPAVRVMFPMQDDVHAALQRSRDMQTFLQDSPGVSEVYALMCMRRRTKALLGMEMDGEMLRRDVPQEVVYFTDYTLADPGPSEAEARQRIARGLFESLIVHVANRIDARKREKIDLIHERDEVLAQMHSASAERRPEYEAGLRRVLDRLGELVAALELDHYHKDFEIVLLEPEKYVFLEYAEMNLDSMGIVRQPDTSGSAEVRFCDLIGRDRRRWTVVIMYCIDVKNRATITDRLASAQRWLGL
jgi:hypothetical protein